ncbi:MAG TPA: cation diffusion facilitator family transporter [Ignavibacteriaceae bacterium]|nr:cation diffusion facilitator family transporter [Ignavibacteriaceae bacterium]
MNKVKSEQMFAIKLSFLFGILMLLMKWYAYYLTGSTAILSDAAESVIHVIGVGFAVFSLWYSFQPADEKHTYGHNKISYFSAGFEGALIILAAVFIIYVSIRRLIFGIEVTNLDQGTYFTFAASVINLFLGGYIIRKGKQKKSIILIANGKHVLTDSWTSFGVVAGLLLVWITGWLQFDPIVAIIVAVNILWTGGKLVRKSIGGLMDEGDENTANILKTILDEEVVQKNMEYHQLKFREIGDVLWIEFHLLFHKGTLLENAHTFATDLENLIKKKLNVKANIITHLEPLELHDAIHIESHK